MLVNDTNFVTPVFNEIKPEINVNLVSPLNFSKSLQSNAPQVNQSTYDWQQSFDKFIQTTPKSLNLNTYYNSKQYEKYHDALLGKPIFKDPRYYDNEELNSKRQGFLGSIFNGSTKAIGSFGQSFVSTFNPFGYDNATSRAMQDFSQNMENWFPNYYSKAERENPLGFNGIFSGNFLGDKLFKNFGFMGGAMTAALVQDAILGTLTGGTALTPTIAVQTGQAANWLSKAFKANTLASKLVAAEKVENFLAPTIFRGEKALEYFNNMTKGQKILTSVKTNLFLANASHGEAAIEALEGSTRVKEDLIQAYKQKYGKLPDDIALSEINKLASESGNIRYGLNFATIFLTDAIQFGSLFKPFKSYTTGQTLLQGLGGTEDRLILDEAGQLVRRNLSKSEKVLGALTGELVRDNVSEGIQEGLQYSFETATHDYARKKWNGEIRGGLGDYLHEQVNGLNRMFTDTEGKESMLLGFLTGFVAHGFKKGVGKLQGRPSLEEREDSIMSDFNSIDFNKMFDTTELSELVKRDVETFNGRTTQEIILNQMQDAVKSGNVFDFKSLQHELFFNGIRTANALGKFDAFVEKLEAMKQLAPEEFTKVFGIEVENNNTVSEYIDKLKDQAVKTKEIIEAVDNTIPNTVNYKEDSKLWTTFNDLKTTMSFHLSSLDNITNRIDSVTSTLLENNPSMTEDLIDKISDIENFSNKFLSPLNQERKSILDTLEIMSQLKEGRDEELFNKTKQQLKDLDNHIDNLNKHANAIKEHFNKTNNWTSDAMLNYKQLVLEVLQYNQQKESGNKIAYTETQLEDTLKALIDFQKLKKSLGIVIDESNKLQTPEGRDKYLKEHLAFLEKYSDGFSEMIKKVNVSTVQKFREQEISNITASISNNLTQVASIINQIEEIDKQLLDDTIENKDQLQLRKDELLKQKQELLDQNKELEETKEVIGEKSSKEIKSDLNTEKKFEAEVADRIVEIIPANLGENLFSSINEKINKTKEELQKINQEVVTNNDLLIYLNNKLEFYLQKINNEQIKIDKQLEKLPNTKYSKKQKQERYEELISKHKDLLLAAQDIQNRINEIEKTNNIQKQEIEDLNKKIQFYQSILNTEKTHTVELQQKLTTTKASLDKTNRLIEKTESYIGRLKSLLKEIVKAISNRISLLNDFLESQGKNTPKLQEDIAKIKTQLLQNSVDGELFKEFNKLEKEVNDVLDHEEINQELLNRAELLLQTQIEKAVKLQNEIRYLNELFQENLNEVKKENTNPNSTQNKKIVEEVKQEIIEEELPEVIVEEVKPIPTAITTPTQIITQTSTPEVEVLPYFGTSRLMHSFYYKLANRTFGNVMIASFHNFLGKLRTFDGVPHKQNLESFLSHNNLQFTVLLAPDELYTANGDYFDEAYKDKKAPIVALTDKEGNLVKVDENNNLSEDGNYIVSLLPNLNKVIEQKRNEDLAKLLKTKENNIAKILSDQDKYPSTDIKGRKSIQQNALEAENSTYEYGVKKVNEKYNKQHEDTGIKDIKDFQSTIEKVKNGEKVSVEIDASHAGHFNFLGEKSDFALTPEVIQNPNVSLFIPNTKTKGEFNGYNLMNGKLYLKIEDDTKPVMFLDVKLSKLNDVYINDKLLSKTIYDVLNHIIANPEESLVYKQEVFNFLDSVLYLSKENPVEIVIGKDSYEFKTDTLSENPFLQIKKNGEVVFELSNTKKDEVSKLQNIFKLFDINDKNQEEIKIPILENGKLSFETQDYKDFLVQSAKPVVRYPLDFSKPNPFDFTGGEIYFKLPSKVEEAFSETSTTYNQSEISNQSDIEAKNTISNGDKIISVQTKPVTDEITDTAEDLFILPDKNPEGRIHINMEPLKDILVVPNNTLTVIDKRTGKEVVGKELNPEGAVIFEAMQGRLFVVANINGQLVPFYKSSAGTSGKTQGAWYPFFGYTGAWLVKGRVDKAIGKMSYSPEIDRVTTLLNENLVFPDKYIDRATNSIKNTKGEVIIDMNQAFKVNRLWQKEFGSQTGKGTNYQIKGLKENTRSESGIVALITGLNTTELDNSKTPKELSEWFNLISKNAELDALEGKPTSAAAPISDIEAEKQKITPAEFKEVVRLAKFFLDNPKEPTVAGSVVTKYPNLFKEITAIERRRQEALDKANKQIEKTNKKEDRRIKVETYTTLDIGGNSVEVEITTNADGSRVLRARQINEDGSVEPMAYVTERINNKAQASLTNEKLIEGYIGNEGNTLKRTNVDENPNQTYIDKINAKYGAELNSLKTQETSIDEKTLEGFSTQEELFKSFNVKPLEQSNDNSELTKEVAEPIKITKEDKFKGLDDEIPKIIKSAKSLPIIQSLNVTNTDIERVKAIFKGNVNIENLFQIANSDAWATFQQSAITLFKGATRADLFHEAWHHFSQLYLTKDEKIRLYNETRNRVKELVGKSDLEVEEYIAREFAKFTETGKIEGKFPERKSIFQKIMDFLKSIFSNETDLSLESLFNNLYKGQINHLAYNTENIMFGKLNSSINDNFNYNDSKLILSGLDALFIQVLEYYKISGSQLSNIENINSVYNSVAKVLKNIYDASFNENEESINPTISINLGRISDNWNDVKKAHYKESVIFNKDRDSYEFNDEGELISKEENEDDKKGRNKADFQEASEKSIFDIMDKEVKSLIFTLIDKDKNGNEIVDPVFGLPKLVDFQRYVSIISEKLSNQNTFADVEKVLNELSKDYPPMKDLLNSLTINESSEVKHLRVQFIQNMALVKRKLYTILYNEEHKIYVPTLSSSNKKKQAENNIVSHFFISTPSSIITDVNGENQITKAIEYKQNQGLVYDLKFIKDLGIDSEFIDYMSIPEQKQFIKDMRLAFVVDHLNNYLEQNKVIKDLFKALNTEVKGKKQDSTLKTLVDYNLKYKPDNISSSFLNASGKIENENVLWATLDRDFNSIQNAKSIIELNQNPNRVFYNYSYLDMQHSKIMDMLFDKSGNRTKEFIQINNYNGLDTTKQGTEGKKTKEVFYTEKAIMDISQFLNGSILTTMQLSNKSTYWGFQFSKPLISDEYDFNQTMMGYLFDELNIISEFDQGNPELTKLNKLSKAIGTKNKYNFAVFKDILKSNPQDIINEYLETGSLSDATQSLVLQEIKDFVKAEVNAHVQLLGDDIKKLNPVANSKYYHTFTALNKNNQNPYEFLIEAYIQNQFAFNVELSKLTFGNPYMHKDPYKRIAGATSSGRRMLVDKKTLEDFNSVTKETQRSSVKSILLNRLGLEELNLKNQRTSDEELRFIAFKDREYISEVFDNLISTVNNELSKTQKNTSEYNALLQKKIAIEKAYSSVNGSDAMGACTLDFWRKVNWLAGRWSTELENIYQKTIKWDYYNRLLKASKIEEEKIQYLSLRDENSLKDDEVIAIAILKYQYYGNVKNMSIMEKAFHKYQLMPLIPQLIDGKNWEQHLDRMLLDDVDYALFDSADKLEKTNNPELFYNNEEQDSVNILEDYKSSYQEGNTSYNVRTGYLENLKEQVFMENGQDNSLLFGSQVRKLLFNTEDFSDLYDEFRDIIQQLTQIEKDNLYQKSGLNESGQVVDKPKFIQFLLDELDKKVVNLNVKEYLRLTKAGEFAGSLDTNLQRQPIESIVNSVIQSKIVKQKMHGELMVQVSNVGFETFGKKDSLKFYELENGKVRKMEVKVPLSGKFKNLLNLTHSDGRKIETRERLNEMISKGLIDTRSITMIGYRIPTQEHNSIEVMQVQEFLDPISNLIVVPYEITAKAGSDFDIDKLNIFKPHIDENGNYLIKEIKDPIIENLNKIQAEIDQLKVNKKISSTKQSNKYLEILSKAKLTSQEITEILEYRDTLSSEIGELYSELKSFSKLDNNNPMFSQFSKLGLVEDNLETEKELSDKINLKIEEKRKQFNSLEEKIDQKAILDNELKTQSEKQKQKTLEYNNKIKPFYEQKYIIKKLLKSFDKFCYQNRIIEIFDKVLLSPNNFLNLVTPNSTFMFDEALDDVFRMRYKSNEYYEKGGKLVPNDIKLTKSLIPRYNWFTFKVLGEAGAGLGIAAVGNTFSQLIQKAKVNFTEEYLSGYNLRLPIGDISTRVLKDGQSKATAYSQLINLLVDVANDPRIGYANMGDIVIPIVNLMINFGIPIQDIVYLINQPIIVDYVSYISKNRKSVVDGEYQEDSFESYLKDKILNHQKTSLKLPEPLGNYLKLTAQELTDKLSEIEFNVSKENMKYSLSDKSAMNEEMSQQQLLILAQFAQMQQIAKDFLQLQVTMNFDTTLVQDGFAAFEKEELFKEIKNKNIFTNLDDLREKTVIAPLNVLKEVININAQLLPLANDKVIYNFLSAKLATEFANKGNKAKKKFVRTFKNDFIMYLFQNFMDRNSDAMLRFNTTFAPVLKTEEKDYTNRPIAFGNYLIKNLYKEFADIKNDSKYKDLFRQYLILDRLFVSSEEEVKNIGLSYFNKDSQLQDTYIEQFKELLNNPDLEIRNFMLKFAYMSFYQSGLNKSFISSTDILPVPILSGILEDVREQYLKEFDTPIKKLNLLDSFYNKMQGNNEFMRTKESRKSSNNITKVSSYRGKNYRDNIDALLIQPVNTSTQQTTEQPINKEIKPKVEYKDWANKVIGRFSLYTNEVLKKDQIENLNHTVDLLIQDFLKVATFAKEDLKNRQYLPFINRLKENGFKQVEGKEWLLTKDGISPEELYKQEIQEQPIVKKITKEDTDKLPPCIG